MTTDLKIRSGSLPVSTSIGTEKVSKSQKAVEAPASSATGHSTASGFEQVAENRTSAGVRDRSIGVRDRSIGVGDTAAGVRDRSIGVRDRSFGVGDTAEGVRDRSIGVRDRSIGVGDTAEGVRDRSIGVRDRSIGVRDRSIGVGDDAAGVRDRSIGVRDRSIGVRDRSIGVGDDAEGVRDRSIGVRDRSIGTGDDAEGVRDRSIGVRDRSIGVDVGPQRTAYEEQVKATLEKYLEVPSYLRDDPGASARKLSNPAAAAKAGLAGVPASTTNALMEVANRGANSGMAQVIGNVVTSDLWKSLPADQKAGLAAVMSKASEKCLQALGALVEGTPDAFKNKDLNGKTLIDNLAQLSTQKVHKDLAPTQPKELLEQVLRQVANPDRIDQGHAPTCTVTSMQYDLVRDEPAEYVRLLSGLTGEGSVKMRGGGKLELDKGSLANSNEGREASEAVFQTAVMEYANGADDYDVKLGYSVRAAEYVDAGEEYAGLRPYQQTVMLRQIFGVKYETVTLENPQQRTKALNELRDYTAVGAKNRPVLIEIDQGDFNHAVTFEMLKNERVYFRDPYGQLRSFPEQAWNTAVVGVHKPQDL